MLSRFIRRKNSYGASIRARSPAWRISSVAFISVRTPSRNNTQSVGRGVASDITDRKQTKLVPLEAPEKGVDSWKAKPKKRASWSEALNLGTGRKRLNIPVSW